MERNSVEIVSVDDKFVVRIAEDGETSDKSFVSEVFARSYANGQRIRLECDELIAQDQIPIELSMPQHAEG
jgi:hypothetical protein